MPPTLVQFIALFLFFLQGVLGQTSYANDFVDPDYVAAKAFGANTQAAQATISKWAIKLAADGPWSVMNKNGIPPSGTKHDYLSWAPYWWPDCSSVGNTTELPAEEVWTKCPYVQRDGQFNPDVRLVNDVGNFQSMSDAVLYNAIASVFNNQTSSNTYSKNVAKFINTWFLADDTKMNPNLNYGQIQRGPTGQTGTHTGVLDLKCLTKVASAILILRKIGSADWTTDLDNKMIAWAREYITWLETADIAVQEGLADNNHGTFYYNQLASLKILVNDLDGAKNVTDTYFKNQYLSQIASNGDQTLETSRTRPYHYRAYNLAAMITNARLAKFVDPTSKVWNQTTKAGATIKTALDYAMTIPASSSGETSYAEELYPSVAAVASTYGDANNKYLNFLKSAAPDFAEEAYFFWNQPWALDLNVGSAKTISTSTVKNSVTSTVKTGTTSTNTKPSSTSKTSDTAKNAARGNKVSMKITFGTIIAGVLCLSLLA